ncbi:unnamed protein product, partial [marine sediment metagenome]
VSTTMSPVTQVAEVAVKRASRKVVSFPDAVERGKRSSIVPIPMIVRKAKITTKEVRKASSRD